MRLRYGARLVVLELPGRSPVKDSLAILRGPLLLLPFRPICCTVEELPHSLSPEDQIRDYGSEDGAAEHGIDVQPRTRGHTSQSAICCQLLSRSRAGTSAIRTRSIVPVSVQHRTTSGGP